MLWLKTFVLIIAVLCCLTSTLSISAQEVRIGEAPRDVEVYVPESDDGTPMPLIFVLHGFRGNAEAIEDNMRFKPLAESRGFLLVEPTGTRDSQGRTFWNGTPACCAFDDDARNVNDSDFLRGLIDEAKEKLNVDPQRVYFVGH